MKKMKWLQISLFAAICILASGCQIKRELEVSESDWNSTETIYGDVIKLENKAVDIDAATKAFYGLTKEEAEVYRLTELGAAYLYEKDKLELRCAGSYLEFQDNQDGAGTCYQLIYDGHFSNGMGLSYRLNEIWSDEVLDSGTKEDAIAACEPYVQACGYEDADLTIYTLTEEKLQQIGVKRKVSAPDPTADIITYRDIDEARKSGDTEKEEALSEQMRSFTLGDVEWSKKDEAYWLAYRPKINGVVIDDVNIRLDIIYVPQEERVVFAKLSDSLQESEFIESKPLISKKQAIESVLLNLGAESEEKIVVKDVSLVYCCDYGTEEDFRRTAWPCWRVDYELNLATQTEQEYDSGTMIINAVNGEKAVFW
ncbi:MAG: hypothetical protein IJ468_15455 [Lachnospiraceae bacterium]|nr:hypothetical protein [Lachnospiraceae bacterium]